MFKHSLYRRHPSGQQSHMLMATLSLTPRATSIPLGKLRFSIINQGFAHSMLIWWNIHTMHAKPLGWGSRLWPRRWRSKSPIMSRVLAATMMHILCEYGECSLNCPGVFALTRCYDLEGQRHDLDRWTGFLLVPWCISGVNMVNVAQIILELSR